MAGLFDFEHYYTNKVIKTSLKLDLSGLDVKSTASSSVANEDGTVDETDMNEYVTNNVMFKISNIVADGKEIGIGDRVVLTVTSIDDDMSDPDSEPSYHYLAIGYPLDDLTNSGLYEFPDSYTGGLIGDIELVVGATMDTGVTLNRITLCGPDDSDSEGTQVNSLIVSAVPRYALMNNTYPLHKDASVETVDQDFWLQQLSGSKSTLGNLARALAAVGLRGTIYKGEKWASQQDSGKAGAVYRNATFKRVINNLANLGKENNIAVKINYFDQSYADSLDPADRKKNESATAYNKRKLKADWTRTTIKVGDKMKSVYGKQISKFIEKCSERDQNPLSSMKNHWETVDEDVDGTGNVTTSEVLSEDATALIPNVSDAFKKLFDDPNDLAQEFDDKFFDTYDSITHIAGVRSFMSSSLVKKLDKAKIALKKTADENLVYYLDVASCYNLLYNMMHHESASADYIQFPKNESSLKNGVRLIGSRDFKVMLNLGRTSNALDGRYTIGCYKADAFARDENYRAIYYETVGQQVYSDWALDASKMSVADIKSMLCDYYSDLYNKRHNKKEGDNGYVRWYYDASEYNEDFSQDRSCRYELTSIVNGQTQTITGYVLPPTSGQWTALVNANGYSKIFEFSMNNMSAIGSTTLAVEYPGTSRMFIDIAVQEISALINASGSAGIYQSSSLKNDDQIDVVEWESCSTAGNYVSFFDYRPMYKTIDGIGEATTYTVNDCVKFADDVMGDAIDEIDTILTTQGVALGPAFLILQKSRLRSAKTGYAELEQVIGKIKWYQKFTNESVFYNKTFIGTRPTYASCPYVNMPARFLLPVELVRKVRVKYKKFFRTRHKMVNMSIGVRWVEVTLVDNDVYSAYPQNTNEPMQYYSIGKNATVSGSDIVFDEPLEGSDMKPGTLTQFGIGRMVVRGVKQQLSVTFAKSDRFTYDSSSVKLVDGDTVFVEGIYVPLEKTAKSDERTRVRLEYKMPYIPYDSEIRRWAFLSYGAFDQSKYASETREVPADDDKLPGWQIFHRSSKRIGDMRPGMGIYDAVSILVGILRNAYGAPCVELAETIRSKEDQAIMSSGGGESTFLSWHNYGLAVKILINDPNTGLPIEDGSDDMRKLIEIAKAFTNACYTGAFGQPINVVWCGRLKMGANNFVWEFLPIGVEHKDAMKFREALLNQEDPVASFGYVDVDAAGYVYDNRPKEKVPYVLRNGSTYTKALVINGHHYVSPRNIRNYTTPHDIVLLNVLEFCNLIRTKMEANGSQLNGRANIYEWKTLNDKSYKQLLMYYGMTGSISAARALICGEYVETYRNIVDRKFSENAVEMTRDYLGELFNDAKIYIEDSGDGGAWISLHDGRLHIRASNLKSSYKPDFKGNFFCEKMAPIGDMERGRYIDGIFYTDKYLDENGHPKGLPLELVSEHSYIDGLDDDGNITGDDAMLLYRLISIQLKETFDELKETFENYGGGIMYDHFADGPNAGMADMVENEFGLIKGQDLIDFDSLEAIFAKKEVDGGLAQQYETDGNVYEKVVSNAELAGVRKASLTREHVTVNVKQGGMTTEQLYKLITKGGMTQAADMFSR